MNYRIYIALSFLHFSAFSQAQPGLNHVYVNPFEPSGPAESYSVFIDQNIVWCFIQNLQCPECSNPQRISLAQIDVSGESLGWLNLGNEDLHYVFNSLKRNSVTLNSGGQAIFMTATSISPFEWETQILYLTKFNFSNGELQLDTIPYSDFPYWTWYSPRKLIETPDGDYISVGRKEDTLSNPSIASAAILKTTEGGELISGNAFGNTDVGYDISVSQDGGYWLAASRVTATFSYGVQYPTNAVIIKTDSLGQELWRHEFGGYGNDEITGIIEEPDRLVVAGFQTYDEPVWPVVASESRYNGFMFIRSYFVNQNSLTIANENRIFESELQTYWDKREGPLGFRSSTLSDDYFLWGNGGGYFGPVTHGFLCRINTNLDTMWFRRYLHPQFLPGIVAEGGGTHYINDIAEASDGSIYLVGHIRGYFPPEYPWNIERLWLLHVDEHGCLEPGCHLVGTEEIITHMTETMSVYPNPARDNCTIAFSLIDGYTAPAQSQLKLVDMQGRIVRTIALSGAEVASGTVQVDLGGLASGVYVAHWMSSTGSPTGSATRWMDSVKIVVE
jgi:hypothetical protein